MYVGPVATYYASVRPPGYTLHCVTLTLTLTSDLWAKNRQTNYSCIGERSRNFDFSKLFCFQVGSPCGQDSRRILPTLPL